MNANELADWIENGAPFGKYETAKQAVVMLRQQQAEIEELKAKLGCDPAYFDMPARKLTDEEIGQIWMDCMESPYMQVSNPVGFARAILRKAQEK